MELTRTFRRKHEQCSRLVELSNFYKILFLYLKKKRRKGERRRGSKEVEEEKDKKNKTFFGSKLSGCRL